VHYFLAPRRRGLPALVCAALLSLTLTPEAFANDAKIEGEAKKLQQDAMDVDFLGLDLKKAQEKLKSAIKKCGKDKCSKPLLASLHRDLGIVELNAGNQAEGEKEFATALANDPNVSVGKDYLDNAAVKKGWENAKKKKGGGGEEPPVGGGETGDTGAPPPAEGGLSVKAAIAPVGYELPLIIIVPSGIEAKTIKVSYKSDAMEKYKSVEAKKTSGKWLVILPCDVTAKTGTIKYFVKAFDDSDGEIEHYGTIKKPAQIKLVDSMPDDQESPQLPGGKDPKECKEAGGEGAGGTTAEGEACKEDDECEKGLVCSENDTGKKVCRPGEKKPGSDAPKLWVGAGGQIDLIFLGKETDICKASGWTCSADVGGSRRDLAETADNDAIRVGATGGKTDGGMSVATKRVFVSLDYFVAPRISLGGRLGYTFGLNPTDIAKSFPLHAEARVQYFITDGTFRPFFMANAGYGAFDAPVPNVIVHPQDPAIATHCQDAGTEFTSCPDDRKVIKGVTAYKLVGPFFVGLGIGAWLHPTPRVAIGAAAKVIFPLPVFAVTFAPEASVSFAF